MDKRLLARQWTHAHEEDDKTGAKVYRPSGGKFPPSRGREKLDLTALAGKQRKIGADDRYVETRGAWDFDDASNTLMFTPEGEGVVARYEVLSLSEDQLVLKRQVREK